MKNTTFLWCVQVMCFCYNLSSVKREPVFEIFDQVRHKPSCTATAELRLEISDLESRGIVLFMLAQQICALLLAYAKHRYLMTRFTNHDNHGTGCFAILILNIAHDNEWLQEHEHIG